MTGTDKFGTVTDVSRSTTTEANDERPARQRRKAIGLTQEQLAAIVGCSQATIFDVETGRSTPSLKLALAIADALDSTVDALFAEGVA